MLKTKTRILSMALVFFSTTGQAVDYKSLITPNFNVVTSEVLALAKSETAKNVLVVYDIDNTLLATTKDFGSEHWFLWQRQLIEGGVKTNPAVAYNLEDLLTAQSWIYQVGRMHPVAPQIPSQIQHQRSLGVSAITLTSRSAHLRDTTLGDIQRNKINLSSSREFGFHDLSEPFLPYQLDQLQRVGLTQQDVRQFKLGQATPTIFDRGVFLTQGQHKGVMLKTLLARMHRSFTGIVFVDDRASHIEGMRAAFADRPEKLVTIQYTKQAEVIQAFHDSDKHQVIGEWCKLSRGVISTVLTRQDAARFIPCR